MSRVTVIETNLEFSGSLQKRESTNLIVIHHTGGVDDNGNPIDTNPSAAEIHKDHLNRGWLGIGYHYVIRKDGTIERGRWRNTIGSQCYNHNWESIGIHVGGNSDAAAPTDAQLASLAALIAALCEIYNLDPEAAIIGHRDRNATACPGEGLYSLLPNVRERVAGFLAAV